MGLYMAQEAQEDEPNPEDSSDPRGRAAVSLRILTQFLTSVSFQALLSGTRSTQSKLITVLIIS